MTRWIRFLLTALCAFFRPKADPRKETRLKFRVWPTDADVNIVNNAATLGYTELGRLDYLIRSGLFQYVQKKGLYFPASEAHISFKRPLKRFQKLELRTRMICWDPKWAWMEQTIYFKKNGEDVLAARLYMRGTLRKGRETVPLDVAFKEMGFELAPMEKPAAIALLEQAQI